MTLSGNDVLPDSCAIEAVASPYALLPGGATLYYTDEGEGQALLFVHGWTCDSNDYLHQIAWFRAKFRVIAADLRGHGRSGITSGSYEARRFARDLIELLDFLGVHRCIVVGHSLGGLIASVLAVGYPERIVGVVCLDPAYGVTVEQEQACHALIDLFSRRDWPRALAREFADWDLPTTPEYFRELHVRRMLAMDRQVVKQTFEGLFIGVDPLAPRERSATYLVGRTCPVLGIYALDKAEHAAWDARHTAHSASRFLHLPLGHWVHQDAPEVVNRVIEQWLGTLPDTPPAQLTESPYR